MILGVINKMTKEQIENAILELIEISQDLSTSDIQGLVMALAQNIKENK